MVNVRFLHQQKSKLVKLACELGVYRLARWLTQDQVKILMMHRFSEHKTSGCIDVACLKEQLSLLKRDFNVVPLSDVLSALQGHSRLPKNAIVLTVDDGYQDFYHLAFPEFKAANLPVTLFVTTGFVDRECWLWPDRIAILLKLAGRQLEVELSAGLQLLPVGEHASWQKINDHLLPLPLAEKNRWIEQCAAANGIVLPTEISDDYAPVTWPQLQEMLASVVEVGGHTLTHPILAAESDDEVEHQLTKSKVRLQEMLGCEVSSFCYPNGQVTDFTQEIEQQVERSGYKLAVAANCDSIKMNNLFNLPRFVMSENRYHFLKVINGVQWISRRFFPKARSSI